MSAKKGHRTERLVEGEEEESEVTQKARAGMRGGEKEKDETQESDKEKMEKAGKRGGETRKEDVPQGLRVTNEKQVKKKPSEVDPSACGNELLRKMGKEGTGEGTGTPYSRLRGKL